MNTHELIESTMLHAMGFLDDSEREAYEAAFDAAPVSIQQRVREEARRMADLGDLIPETEASTELRGIVLAAVRAAMREEENEARIAQAQTEPAAAAAVIGRIDSSTAANPSATTTRTTSQPKLSTSQRVNSLWRIAAVGFAAACIAMGVIVVNIQQTYQQAQSRALVASLYDTIGAKYLESTIFDANTQRVALTSETNSDQRNSAIAAVWSNPDWDTARLFVKNLAAENQETYRLVVLDENGEIFREIKTFTPSGEFEDFDVDVNLSTERSLAIYPSMTEEIQEAAPLLLSSESTL